MENQYSSWNEEWKNKGRGIKSVLNSAKGEIDPQFSEEWSQSSFYERWILKAILNSDRNKINPQFNERWNRYSVQRGMKSILNPSTYEFIIEWQQSSVQRGMTSMLSPSRCQSSSIEILSVVRLLDVRHLKCVLNEQPRPSKTPTSWCLASAMLDLGCWVVRMIMMLMLLLLCQECWLLLDSGNCNCNLYIANQRTN